MSTSTLQAGKAESIVKTGREQGDESMDAVRNANVVVLHIGEPDYSNTQYRYAIGEQPPTQTRRLALSIDLFQQVTCVELTGLSYAKTMLTLPDGATSFNLTESFDQITSLMATAGADTSLVLAPISPNGVAGGLLADPFIKMFDKDTSVEFVIDPTRGYTNAGCGSAEVWDVHGNEHWARYGRNWDSDTPYPLDQLISQGLISKVPVPAGTN